MEAFINVLLLSLPPSPTRNFLLITLIMNLELLIRVIPSKNCKCQAKSVKLCVSPTKQKVQTNECMFSEVNENVMEELLLSRGMLLSKEQGIANKTKNKKEDAKYRVGVAVGWEQDFLRIALTLSFG